MRQLVSCDIVWELNTNDIKLITPAIKHIYTPTLLIPEKAFFGLSFSPNIKRAAIIPPIIKMILPLISSHSIITTFESLLQDQLNRKRPIKINIRIINPPQIPELSAFSS